MDKLETDAMKLGQQFLSANQRFVTTTAYNFWQYDKHSFKKLINLWKYDIEYTLITELVLDLGHINAFSQLWTQLL